VGEPAIGARAGTSVNLAEWVVSVMQLKLQLSCKFLAV
jgi:hypothetical protein